MLNERYLERYADVLLWGLKTARRGRFRKGNVILIQYDRAALRLAEILYEKIIATGMNPVQRMGLTVGMERSFFGKSGGRQLVFHPRGEGTLRKSPRADLPPCTRFADPSQRGRPGPDRQGPGRPQAAPRHPRAARAGGGLRLDPLHAADGGACRAGPDNAGGLRETDHPVLLPGPQRPGR